MGHSHFRILYNGSTSIHVITVLTLAVKKNTPRILKLGFKLGGKLTMRSYLCLVFRSAGRFRWVYIPGAVQSPVTVSD